MARQVNRSLSQAETLFNAAGRFCGCVPPACAMSGRPAALAAHLLRDEVHELASLDAAGRIRRHAGDQRDFPVGVDGAEHDDAPT